MIDTHAHIDTEAFDADRAGMLERAREAGVEAVIIPAITPDCTELAEHLVQEYPWIWRSVGIHPHHASMATPAALGLVERDAAKYRVVAIGEIGLDYYYTYASPQEQQSVFREQLRIAKHAGLPVIIHNRQADEDVLRILEEEQDGSLRGVLHCFSSSVDVAQKALQLGMHVSFTGNITFPRWKQDNVLQMIPEGRFMIETDAPYMTPVPHRGKRNEPAFVRFIAERLAQVRSTTFDQIVMHTTTTARQLFRLMLIAIVLLCLPGVSVWSIEDVEIEDVEEDSVVYEHPYPKTVGLGFLVGPNTIVETQRRSQDNVAEPISYEGIPSFGGTAVWELTDRWMLDVAFIYSVNRKVVKSPDNPFGYQDNPDYYLVLEAGMRYLINPYSRVVFYGFLGGSSVWVSRDAKPYGAPQLCIAPGIGLFVNIPTPIGTIVPGGEWRLSFFTREETRFIGRPNGEFYKATISTFFSIPRFSLLYFPQW